MNIITLPDANISMIAGKENENTVPIRVTLFQHPEYKTNPPFYGAPYTLDVFEKEGLKQFLREQIIEKLGPLSEHHYDQISDTLIESLPPIWITMMHGWAPVIVSLAPPQQMGYNRVSLEPKPTDN